MDFYLNLLYKERAGKRINDTEHGMHDDISINHEWVIVKDSFAHVLRPELLIGEYPERGQVVESTYKDGTKDKETIMDNGNIRLGFETHNGTGPGCEVSLTPQEAKELGMELIQASEHQMIDEKGIRQYSKTVSAPQWILDL